MCAYKSLEAYNQATCGWVRNIIVKKIGMYSLVLAKVMHSQRLQEKYLSLWIITKHTGEIETAHCDCVAGFSGVCTHVSAVLFVIDKEVRNAEEVTRTGVKAYWSPPTNKPTEPKRVANIDFRTSKRRYSDDNSVITYKKSKESMLVSEQNVFLTDLMESDEIVVSHLVTEPFPEQLKDKFNYKKKFYIMELFREEYMSKSVVELLNIGKTINITPNIEDCKGIENETKTQTKVKSWYSYRAGRVTTSKFKSCCRTSIEKPSISLIKSICYPTIYKFKARSLDHGCKHESEAIKQFVQIMEAKHQGFWYEKCAFVINPNFSYFGASPDGLIGCNCSDTDFLEIKCPCCARFSGVVEQLDKDFYLQACNREVVLKNGHAYYYQVQMQLAFILKSNLMKNFGRLKIKKPNNFFTRFYCLRLLGNIIQGRILNIEEVESVQTEEIYWDPDISWANESNHLLTELQPSRTKISTTENIYVEPQPSTSKVLYYTCRQEDDEKTPMLACDSKNCTITWYHLRCIGLNAVPEGRWLCNNCLKNSLIC